MNVREVAILFLTLMACFRVVSHFVALSPCEFTAMRAVARMDLDALRHGLERHAADHEGIYPPDLEGLLPLAQGVDGYLESRATLHDPWRRPYIYRTSHDRRSFLLSCLGSDGAVGGEGEAEDLEVRGGGTGR